jgi:hypothetical protein
MRTLHLIAGLLGVLVFVLSGQAIAQAAFPVAGRWPAHDVLSRRVYILGSALVNLALGIYLKLEGQE